MSRRLLEPSVKQGARFMIKILVGVNILAVFVAFSYAQAQYGGPSVAPYPVQGAYQTPAMAYAGSGQSPTAMPCVYGGQQWAGMQVREKVDPEIADIRSDIKEANEDKIKL